MEQPENGTEEARAVLRRMLNVLRISDAAEQAGYQRPDPEKVYAGLYAADKDGK